MIPERTFGICPRCGRRASMTVGTGCDAGGRDEDGAGYDLHKFRGEYMCFLCKQEILKDEQSLMMAEKHATEEQFRSSVGFSKTIT